MITLAYENGQSLIAIEFDATIREDHQGSTTVTEHNVETGANISDHSRPELRKITCDVFVSDTPIEPPRSNTDGVTGQFSAVDIDVKTRVNLPRVLPGIGLAESFAGNDVLNRQVATSVQVLNFDGTLNRVRSVYADLEKLRTTSTLVRINSFLTEYTNMVIRTVSAPRGAGDGSAMTFSFTATEIRFAESQVVAVKADIGAKKTTRGAQPAKQVPPEMKQSIADKSGVSMGALTDAAPDVAGLH